MEIPLAHERSRLNARQLDRIYIALLLVAILAYVVLFSARTISTYLAGNSLFDLAVYEQGFWNALGNPPFYYSLEGDMSRFGRHFSPVFYLILPFYMLHRDPSTLLIVQSLAIGLGALPLYGLATARVGRFFGLLVALAYLLNPAVNDINVQNDFHEIAFALPALILAIYLAERANLPLYLAGLVLALSTREEVSLTTTLFGLYLLVFRRQLSRGLATILISLVWFFAVFGVVMPAFNVSGVFPLPDGYGYLGNSLPNIVRGALSHPDLLLGEILRPPKQSYVFWLLEPVAFLALLAPEALLVAGFALLEVLASNYIYHFAIFERYASPIVPFIFFAAIVGAGRLVKLLQRSPKLPAGALIAVALLIATIVSQTLLHKFTLDVSSTPDSRVLAALDIARTLPSEASVSVADHRLSAHLAHRRSLYTFESSWVKPDYLLFDRYGLSISTLSREELKKRTDELLSDPGYRVLRCEDGIFLLGRRNGPAQSYVSPKQPPSQLPRDDRFADGLRLTGFEITPPAPHPGSAANVVLTWTSAGRASANYKVFLHVLDAQGKQVAQSDGIPGNWWCSTDLWDEGITIRDAHSIEIPADAPPGRYEVQIGLYDPQNPRRLAVVDANDKAIDDHTSASFEVKQ